MTMKRCNFYLADIQIRRLRAIQKKTGLPLSDILRRAIDEYWERFERKEKPREKKNRSKDDNNKTGNTSCQGRQFGKGLERDHSFFQEIGGKVWSVGAGGSSLFQKPWDQETGETQRASDWGMPLVPEAGPDQQETPQ